MLGTVCKTEETARNALHRIKAAGYDALELNDFMLKPSPLLVRMLTKAAGMPVGACGKLDWKALLTETGLGVTALHTNLGMLEREPEAVYEEAQRFGTDRLVITGMYRFDYSNRTSVENLAERLNAAGKKAAGERIRLFYHNHNAELLRTDAGEAAYLHILRGTDPTYVNFEFDSYWFADAGADPLAWMQLLGSRMQLWHINDRGIRSRQVMSGQSHPSGQSQSCGQTRLNGRKAVTPILKADSMELGTGNMPLDRLMQQAKANGVESVILESHRNWIDGDPLKSMECSMKWLQEHF